jgi:hypothetical protein
VTDVTEGTSGNGERIAFLYDTRKVKFTGMAGELVLPKSRKRREEGQPDEEDFEFLQFARTPYVCEFQCGWSKFQLCSVHIYYGEGVAEDPRRVKEIGQLAGFLAARANPKATAARPNPLPNNVIVLGDFNIFSRDDATMEQLTKAGFVVPEAIQQLPAGSNLGTDKYYDQIAFYEEKNRLQFRDAAGVFDWQKSVFPRDAVADYSDLLTEAPADAAKRKRYYNDWRTYQMSDHLPMWVELDIDFSDEYLEKLAQASGPPEETPALG